LRVQPQGRDLDARAVAADRVDEAIFRAHLAGFSRAPPAREVDDRDHARRLRAREREAAESARRLAHEDDSMGIDLRTARHVLDRRTDVVGGRPAGAEVVRIGARAERLGPLTLRARVAAAHRDEHGVSTLEEPAALRDVALPRSLARVRIARGSVAE